MSFPSISPEQNIYLSDEYRCPVSFEPLDNAVTVFPCAHKIQESVAETLYKRINNSWQVRPGKSCPL